MSHATLSAVPTFDEAALARMALDVDDRAFTSVFATRYRELLAGRVSRIHHALHQADVAAALDASLSLKVASVTVGTCELADLALGIEDDVRRYDVAAARVVAARLPGAAARADQALAEYLHLSA